MTYMNILITRNTKNAENKRKKNKYTEQECIKWAK